MSPLRAIARGRVETYRLVVAALTVGVVVAQFVLGRVDRDWAVGGALAATIVLTVLVFLLGESRVASMREARAGARGETLLDLGHTLEPLTREVGRVSALSKPERRAQNGALRQAVVSAAAGLAPGRLRASYFALDASGLAMPCVATTGRAIQPKAGFEAGVKSGDTALQMIRDNEYLFWEDTDRAPPPGWVPSNNREYRTFISVTVGTPGHPRGMLTLDAPTPGDLTDEDVKMMLVLGHILGTCEQLTR